MLPGGREKECEKGNGSGKGGTMNFPDTLIKIMTRMNVTQACLSITSGIERTKLNKIISGHIDPKFSDVIKITEGLNMNLSDLQRFNDGTITNEKPLFNEHYIIRPIVVDTQINLTVYYAYILHDIRAFGAEFRKEENETFFMIRKGRAYFCGKSYFDGDVYGANSCMDFSNYEEYYTKGTEVVMIRISKAGEFLDIIRNSKDNPVIIPVDFVPE